MKVKRFLRLYVCDYDRNIVCNLYDSESDILGQAYDIHIDSDRNSYKELSFNLPPKVMTEDGNVDNFRLNYLIADYQILAVTKDRTDPEREKEINDYFLISEPRITHSPISKEISVTCKHNSQMLGYKNLELEFSDEEGNNVATADVFLSIILDGTGWRVGEVYNFKEDDGVTTKVRTLVASTKTGALKLISLLCEKFDAKPVYHSEEKTVDLLPLNPFSKKESDVVADIIKNHTGVLELNYKRNLKSVSRTLNTDNIITKFYVYGSYGDYQTGYCSIKTYKHKKVTLNINEASFTNEYWFETNYGDKRYFVSRNNGPFYWSSLDLLSRSYVYTVSSDIVTPYELTTTSQTGSAKQLSVISSEEVITYVPYLMNFSYYRKIGLLKDNQLRILAQYQYSMPVYYKQSEDAATAMNEASNKLSETAESSTGFLRLAATGQNSNGKLRLNITKSKGDNGVLYRSDYYEKKKNFFSWYVADQIKPNGDAVNGGSKVLIVHNTNPPTWEFAYVKEIYHVVNGVEELIVDNKGKPTHYIYGLDKNEPTAIVLWQNYITISDTDKIFLFCTNSMSGALGKAMATDESIVIALNKKLTQETVPHDVIFTDTDATIIGTTYRSNEVNVYGWLYKYNKSGAHYTEGTLYYMNVDKNINTWREVVFADDMPNPASVSNINNKMFFHNKLRTLWLGTKGQDGEPDAWVQMCKDTEQEIARNFSYVYLQCKERDVAYKGWFERYEKTFSPALTAGNYAMKNEYGSYWLFTTTQNVTNAKYIYEQGHMYQDDDPEHVVPVKYYPFDTLDFPIQNLLEDVSVTTGDLSETGVDIDDLDESQHIKTTYLRAYTDTSYTYNFIGGSNYRVYFFDQNRRYIDKRDLSNSGTFRTPVAPDVPVHPDGNYVGQTYYLRIVYEGTVTITGSLKITNCDNIVIAGTDTFYTILPAVNTSGGFQGRSENLGINHLMIEFRDLAEELYYQTSDVSTPNGGYVGLLEAAKKHIKTKDKILVDSLGDLLRENTWRDTSYAEGDEDRLYSDAMDTFKEISEPEATYEITYLEPFGVENTGYSLTPETNFFNQEVETTDAVHLIDEDLDEDRWAYIDKVKLYYDFTEKTSIQINTKLSTIGQRSFTDVMSHIVDVAKDFKAKETIYDRAEAITSSGQILAEKIKGTLDAYRTLISGGASNWYTDEKGNMIFESVDGNSAMMLAGAGLMIACTRDEYGDWQWQTAATGYGIVADAISTGILNAVHIEAGSITTDKISPSVGETLVISNNPAINDVKAQIKVANDSISSEVERAGLAEEALQAYAEEQATAAEGRANEYAISQINQTAESINLTVAKKARVWYSETEPPTTGDDHALLGDYWINTANGNEMKRYNGVIWVNSSYDDPNKYGIVSGVNIDANGVTIGGSSNITLESGSNIIITAPDQITIGTGTLESELASKGSLQSSKVQYYLSESTESLIGSEWQDTAPNWEEDMYMWTRTELTYADGTVTYMPSANGTCIAGAKGDSGNPAINTATVVLYKRGSTVPTKPGSLTYNFSTGEVTGTLSGWSKTFPTGNDPCYSVTGYAADTATTTTISSWSNPVLTVENGEDGNSSYTYVRYATDNQGTGMTSTPTSETKYIGICVTDSATAPSTASSYTWSKYAGDNGTSSYTYVRYATDNQGSGMTATPSANTKYIGVCISNSSTAPTTPSSYAPWTKYLGDNGLSSYTYIRYATDSSGTGMSSTPTSSTKYIGVCVTSSSTAPSTASSYTWSKYAGDDGVGITVSETYAVNNSDSTPPSSGWVDDPTTLTVDESHRYMWNWEYIVGTDGTVQVNDKHIVYRYSKDGAAGRSITGVTNWYLVNNSTTTPTKAQGDPWSTTPSNVTSNNKYLWNYEVISYSSGTPTETDACIIGVYGDTGTGIASVSEQYAINNDPDNAPTSGWQSNPMSPTESNPYLWNWEIIVDTTGATQSTEQRVICRYAKDGDAGRSITGVVNYYLANNDGSTTPTQDGGQPGSSWTTSPQQIAANKRFLWNYEVISYSSGTPTITTACVIGTYGEKGDKGDTGNPGTGISSVIERYVTTASNSTPADGAAWVVCPPGTIPTPNATNPYLWNWEIVTDTNNQQQVNRKHLVCKFGVDGEPGDDGVSITGVTSWYLASSITDKAQLPTLNEQSPWTNNPNGQTLSSSALYLWNYEKITYSSGDPTRTSPCIIGNYAADGQQGPQGVQGVGVSSIVTKYLLHTSPTSTPSTAWKNWSDTVPQYQEGKYYWSWTRTFYTDGTSTQGTKMSEYGMNSAIATATDAHVMAQAIVDGTDYSPSSHNYTKFFNKAIENTAVTISDKDLLMNSQGSMFLNAGGGIFIAAAGSTETSSAELEDNCWDTVRTFTGHNGQYIWVKAAITKTNSSTSYRTYRLDVIGATDTQIEVASVKYLAAASTPSASAAWQATVQHVNSTNKYLWAKYEVVHTTESSTYTNDIIRSIYTYYSGTENTEPANVTNYFALGLSSATAPSSIGYTKTVDGQKVPNNAIVINQSGIAVASDGNISIQAGGTFTVESGNFNISDTGDVSIAGNIDTLTGAIGGWTVNADRLYSGSNTTYVALDSGSTIEEKAETTGTSSGYYLTGNTIINPFAMWAGKEDPYAAPFSVQRDGAIKFKQAKMGNWTFNNDALERRDTAGHIIISSDYIAGGPPVSRMNGAPFSRWIYYNYWKLSVDGTLECQYGKLGEWDLDTYRISNGSESNYVAIDAGSTVLLYSNYVQYDTKVVNEDTIEYYKNSVLVGTNADTDTLFYYTRSRTKIPTTEYDWEYQDENGNILTYTETTDCCIWTGAEEPRDASFSLKRDGSLKLTGSGSFDIDLTNFKINSENKTLTTGNWTLDENGIHCKGEYAQGEEFTYSMESWKNEYEYIRGINLKINFGATQFFGLSLGAIYTGGAYGLQLDPIGTAQNIAQLGSHYVDGDGVQHGTWESIYGDHVYAYRRLTCSGVLQGSNSGTNPYLYFYVTPTQVSSRKVKHNIKRLNSMGNTIDKLEPVSFIYNNDKTEKTSFGLIYEDTVDILPEICTEDDKGENKGIGYTELIPILLKEIQDLRKRVKELEDKLG